MSTWKPEAERLLASGMTYAQVGAALNRSAARVHRVVKPKVYPKKSRVDTPDSEITKQRRLTRRWCRRHAARLGKSIEALYEEYGVADLDRTALWDEKHGAV